AVEDCAQPWHWEAVAARSLVDGRLGRPSRGGIPPTPVCESQAGCGRIFRRSQCGADPTRATLVEMSHRASRRLGSNRWIGEAATWSVDLGLLPGVARRIRCRPHASNRLCGLHGELRNGWGVLAREAKR